MFAKILVWVNCWLFVAFGLGFMLKPLFLAHLITDTVPSTTSAITDMRATYGGMALGLAFIFGQCARLEPYHYIGMQGVFAVMTGLAVSRVLGIILDGNPNIFMFVLLAAEVIMAVFALSWIIKKTPRFNSWRMCRQSN